MTTTEVPTKCQRCGRPHLTGVDGGTTAPRNATPVERAPCAGCGRITVADDGSSALTLAEGYCLFCRVLGMHA